MGIAAVAVYSDADRNATFARYADEAIHIGPASSSYLVASKIIDAARSTGADAIHPGYGFLSENAAFAAAVEKRAFASSDLAPAIETMGSSWPKETVKPFDVPLVPGGITPCTRRKKHDGQPLATRPSRRVAVAVVKARASFAKTPNWKIVLNRPIRSDQCFRRRSGVH